MNSERNVFNVLIIRLFNWIQCEDNFAVVLSSTWSVVVCHVVLQNCIIIYLYVYTHIQCIQFIDIARYRSGATYCTSWTQPQHTSFHLIDLCRMFIIRLIIPLLIHFNDNRWSSPVLLRTIAARRWIKLLIESSLFIIFVFFLINCLITLTALNFFHGSDIQIRICLFSFIHV